MFGTIRRHQKWLWIFIVIATIVSLLYWGQSVGKMGSGSGGGGGGAEINGHRITKPMEDEALREVKLIYFLNTRTWPEQDPERAQQVDFKYDAYIRMFRTIKAEEAGVRVSDEALKAHLLRFLGPYPADKFINEVLVPHNLTADDFERFLRNEAAAQQLSMVVGAAGRLIPPAEAEAIYRRDRQERSGDIVFMPISNYLSKVVITNGALTTWYTNQSSIYRTPDKVRVSYVEFGRTNFVADAERRFAANTNLNSDIMAFYQKKGPNSFTDTNGTPLPQSNALARIREEELIRTADILAKQKANEFANKLDDMKEGGANRLNWLAASNNLPVQVSMAFDRTDGPTNLDVAPKFTSIAFSLDLTNNPVSVQPIEGADGYYVIALKETLPSALEPYEQVQGRVTEDYKRYMAFQLAHSDGTNFIAQAAAGLTAGRTFEESAQKLGLKAEMLPALTRKGSESLTNLDERLDANRLRDVLFGFEPGRISSWIPAPSYGPPEGGYVVYVRGNVPFDENKVREELPRFLAELRSQKQNEIFSQWFGRQIDQTKLPVTRRPVKRPGQG